MSRSLPRPLSIVLLALVAVRVGTIAWSATSRVHGDFYASLPGAHVETLNPTLWNSPDLTDAWGYHTATYFHGPTQYLTLYPLSFLDSYAQIASVLLVVYLAVIGIIVWLQSRAAMCLGADRRMVAPIVISTGLFFPLLQAYLQREFEVVLTAMLAAALLMLLRDRKGWAAALFAYAAWFKYIPLLFAGYLGWRGWWRAVAVFVATSAVVLLVSHAMFGLDRFFNNNVPGHASQVFVLWGYGFGTDSTGHLAGSGFCQRWVVHDSTLANMRHGLCTMAAAHPWLDPALIYILMCLAVAVVYLWAHARLQQTVLSPIGEARRRAIEFSIVTVICSCFFFSHYYYLIALILPLNILLTLYVVDGRTPWLAPWTLAYVLIGAFVIPTGLLTRITGVNVWEFFMWRAWFWYGEVLLMALLLSEYVRLTRPLALQSHA